MHGTKPTIVSLRLSVQMRRRLFVIERGGNSTKLSMKYE